MTYYSVERTVRTDQEGNMTTKSHKTKHAIANIPLPDYPVEQRRRELPRGDGNWHGYEYVYKQLDAGCMAMARASYVYLSDEHVNAMAILGCGHEETMKAEMWRMRGRGFIE